MEVSLKSDEGYWKVLTLICDGTKCLFFRPLKTKKEEDVALALTDIFLDCEVIPRVVQSDRGSEFINKTILEVNTLLGTKLVFAAALHP